jgi:hypothetical protein
MVLTTLQLTACVYMHRDYVCDSQPYNLQENHA